MKEVDTNETLARIRTLMDYTEGVSPETGRTRDINELIECLHTLDDALSHGGILPDDWNRAGHKRREEVD